MKVDDGSSMLCEDSINFQEKLDVISACLTLTYSITKSIFKVDQEFIPVQ